MKITVVKPTFVRRDKRGLFAEGLNGSSWENISYGIMKKGAVMGDHYHKKTKVFLFIVMGNAFVDNIDVRTKETSRIILKENQGIIFPKYISHAIRFTKKSWFVMGKSVAYNVRSPDTYEYKVPFLK